MLIQFLRQYDIGKAERIYKHVLIGRGEQKKKYYNQATTKAIAIRKGREIRLTSVQFEHTCVRWGHRNS